jgi:hypothetical protein
VGAGRAFPLGRNHLRYWPCGRALSAWMHVQSNQDVVIRDVVEKGTSESGMNVQLCRILGTLYYVIPMSSESTVPWFKHNEHYILDAKAGRLIGKWCLDEDEDKLVVTACATHLCLVDVRARTLTLRDFDAARHTFHSVDNRQLRASRSMDGGRWTSRGKNAFCPT